MIKTNKVLYLGYYKEYGDFKSDIFAIIESYKKNGDDFIKHLDGEFSILALRCGCQMLEEKL